MSRHCGRSLWTFVIVALMGTGAARAEEGKPLAASVQGYVDRQELAGAVMLVANREKVLAVESAGWADVAAKRPMRNDSVFWIASQSKPITAAAVMMLVD